MEPFTGLELTALTNAVMASNALFCVFVLWSLPTWFPGVHIALVIGARWLSLGPFALCIHRSWWNFGIFTGGLADHGAGWCENPITQRVSDTCRYGWWAVEYSGLLILPVMLGALGVWLSIQRIQPVRINRMTNIYVALVLIPASLSIYFA